MLGNSLFLGVLLALQQCVSADRAFTEEQCWTKMTSPSPRGHVPTTTYLKTLKFTRTVVVTTTPTTTVTPSKKKTVSTTVTSTTTSTLNVVQITDTYTSVATSTLISTVDLPTQTITSTVVSSETATTTVQPTTTVSAVAGFLPVVDTLPGSSTKKRSSNGLSLLARSAKQPEYPFCGKGENKPKSWPAAVTCSGKVQSLIVTTVTRTAKTKIIMARTPTTTKTSTVTVTSTSLSTTPDASTTITSTLTLSSAITNSPITTTTTFVTSTTTSTSNLPAATSYAQCSSNNIAGHLNGGQISQYADQTGGLSGSATSDTTAEGCCNSCAANPQCAVAIFYAESNFCLLGVGAASCTANQYSLGVTYNPAATSPRYVVSNGNCGSVNVNLGSST